MFSFNTETHLWFFFKRWSLNCNYDYKTTLKYNWSWIPVLIPDFITWVQVLVKILGKITSQNMLSTYFVINHSFWVKTISHKRNFFRFVLKWKHSLIQRISDTVKVKVASQSLLPHRRYSPWNSPGQDTGVGSLSLPQGTSQTRDWTQVSHIKHGFFTSWASREAQEYWSG